MNTFKKWSKEILLSLIFLFFASIIINIIKQPDIPNNSLQFLETNIVGKQDTIYKAPKDKAFVVVFWGSWCPICKQDLGNFSKVANKYDVIGVGVNSGSDSDITKFLKVNDIVLQTINDDNGEIAQKFNVSTYPTTLIYDKDGNLKFTEVGYITTAGLKARLKLIE
ncbi:MAG: redoxin domain-containing protein [Sulfurovaceae bacterium]|nr:redoxin domain-containing protein [Sulfurovaceae bacterium]MDD5360345.1 redoxin domain-containing protein [Sulfurovaceae bacterium]MDD5549265.1 redoxin domain-containing protein [Sulfurovaceae bacterium]